MNIFEIILHLLRVCFVLVLLFPFYKAYKIEGISGLIDELKYIVIAILLIICGYFFENLFANKAMEISYLKNFYSSIWSLVGFVVKITGVYLLIIYYWNFYKKSL